MDTDFHSELLVSLWYDILCVLCFLLCMFLLYITVLLPVGVIKDDQLLPTPLRHTREQQTLLGDLELLGGAANDSLQHLVWADVRLEVARVPQLANQLAEPLHENEHLVAGRTPDARVVLLTQEVVAYWTDMRQCLATDNPAPLSVTIIVTDNIVRVA